jgi:hypothetical protein
VKLPNPDNAVVDIRKLRDYCLNPLHPRGRNKARVFASVLGLTAKDVEILRERLLSAALSEDATPTKRDEYGQRYVLDFEMETEAASATIRSSWIIRHNEDFPRFTSCWIL